MLAIKFKRIGKKHQPSFRVVVAEKRSKLTGKFVEDLGWYNPRNKEFNLNKERAGYWLKNGAQPTDTVYNLFVRAEIISGAKKPVHKKAKKTKKKPSKEAEAEKTETTPEATVEKEKPKEEETTEVVSEVAPETEQKEASKEEQKEN